MTVPAPPPTITLIAAMSRDRVIGQGGGMPWHLPADLRHFVTHTRGKPVIMGRRSYASIGRALPGRHNIVLTRAANLALEGCTVVHDKDAALAAAGLVPEVMVIGGESVYRAFMGRAHRVLLTVIDADFSGDTYFPALGDEWVEVDRHKRSSDAENPCPLYFLEHQRRADCGSAPGTLSSAGSKPTENGR